MCGGKKLCVMRRVFTSTKYTSTWCTSTKCTSTTLQACVSGQRRTYLVETRVLKVAYSEYPVLTVDKSSWNVLRLLLLCILGKHLMEYTGIFHTFRSFSFYSKAEYYSSYGFRGRRRRLGGVKSSRSRKTLRVDRCWTNWLPSARLCLSMRRPPPVSAPVLISLR